MTHPTPSDALRALVDACRELAAANEECERVADSGEPIDGVAAILANRRWDHAEFEIILRAAALPSLDGLALVPRWQTGEPEKPGQYLTYRPAADDYGDHVGAAHWVASCDGRVRYWGSGGYHGSSAVTHWMPLPEKP